MQDHREQFGRYDLDGGRGSPPLRTRLTARLPRAHQALGSQLRFLGVRCARSESAWHYSDHSGLTELSRGGRDDFDGTSLPLRFCGIAGPPQERE